MMSAGISIGIGSIATGIISNPVEWTPIDITDLIVATATASSIIFTWVSEDTESNFRVQLQLAGGNWSSLIDESTSASGSSPNWGYTESGLNPSTSYDFRVRSEKDGVSGDWTSLLGIVTAWGGPYSISNLTEGTVTDTTIEFSWFCPDSESERNTVPQFFRFQLQLSGGDWSSLVFESNGVAGWFGPDTNPNFECNFSDLIPATSYDFRVRSEKDGVSGDWAELDEILTTG